MTPVLKSSVEERRRNSKPRDPRYAKETREKHPLAAGDGLPASVRLSRDLPSCRPPPVTRSR